ncbi:50S ribosomal protein L24 [Larkinella insperata]|uniref:Large ribosomal subunit protein uL24 n=1 Tax=Larkinella insperata TaxID=332158 RepID=A0ABW3QE77_9BACT|nr:50S ribosomal protein L24 [Larkinella insperata]
MKNVADKPAKLHIKKGDTVKVISGNSKGQTGTILRVLVDKQRAVVEGVNMITKHVKPSAANPQGSLEKREGTIHISNLMIIDPTTNEPSRTGRKLNDKGKLQRFSKKSGNFI